MPRLRKTLGNQVLIEDVQERKSDGGIIIPDAARNQEKEARTGKVLAVGPDVSDPEIAPGAYVLFDPFHKRHRLDGRVVKLVSESEVFAVVDGDFE